jgi:hypothetical protein
MKRVYGFKTIKHLEDEKSLWLQNVVCIDGLLVNMGSWGKGDCFIHFAHRQHIQSLIIVCILLYSYIRPTRRFRFFFVV